MENWLVSPPVVFVIILALLFLLNRLFSKLAFRSDKSKPGCCESYACGESNFDNTAQPDYSQFFPFAFFFTLAHVATLIITTIPGPIGWAGMPPPAAIPVGVGALVMASLYIIASIVGLSVLLRK